MWLFTAIGFFSVIQRPCEPHLTVRARVAADLDRLRAQYMPELSGTCTTRHADYRYRATIDHEGFAAGVAKLSHDIRYCNFKAEIGRTLGREREEVYHEVWEVVLRLQKGTAPLS